MSSIQIHDGGVVPSLFYMLGEQIRFQNRVKENNRIKQNCQKVIYFRIEESSSWMPNFKRFCTQRKHWVRH
jgi:hypothetical protein